MWKDVSGYKGYYEVNRNGTIRSKTRTITSITGRTYILKGRELKPEISKNGYLMVSLCKNGKRKIKYVHIIVAKAFILNVGDKPVVNHLDGNKLNCKSSNLEWTSYSANNQHSYDMGLHSRGDDHYKAKLTHKDIKHIRKDGKYATYEEIAAQYGVSKATIRDVLTNKTWKHVN